MGFIWALRPVREEDPTLKGGFQKLRFVGSLCLCQLLGLAPTRELPWIIKASIGSYLGFYVGWEGSCFEVASAGPLHFPHEHEEVLFRILACSI